MNAEAAERHAENAEKTVFKREGAEARSRSDLV
jgi:hypothetical protein